MNYTLPNPTKEISYFLEPKGKTFAEFRGLLPFNRLEGLSFSFIQGCTKNIVNILGVDSIYSKVAILDNNDTVIFIANSNKADIELRRKDREVKLKYDFSTFHFPTMGIFYSDNNIGHVAYVHKLERSDDTVATWVMDLLIEDMSKLLINLLYEAYEVKHEHD